MIKLADRLHNLRTILFVSNRKWIQRKVNQTYTDILDRLEQVKDNLGEDYATEISMLKDRQNWIRSGRQFNNTDFSVRRTFEIVQLFALRAIRPSYSYLFICQINKQRCLYTDTLLICLADLLSYVFNLPVDRFNTVLDQEVVCFAEGLASPESTIDR